MHSIPVGHRRLPLQSRAHKPLTPEFGMTQTGSASQSLAGHSKLAVQWWVQKAGPETASMPVGLAHSLSDAPQWAMPEQVP